jgi:thymidylate synthase (FAD)
MTKYIKLIDYMGSDQAIGDSARISYGKANQGKECENLINYLMEHDHSSPFEMAELIFEVKAPIFIARQWMRHRTFSYNEISLRYTEPAKDYYMPTELRIQSKTNKQGSALIQRDYKMQCLIEKRLQEHFENSFELYEFLINNNVCKEQARMVLPLNYNTTFIVKGNLRNWLHFVKLRMHSTAQAEIRWYADKIADIIAEKFPITWKAFKKFKLDSITLTKQQIKVVNEAINGSFLTIEESGLSERHYQQVKELFLNAV